jgi:hypothetical protein
VLTGATSISGTVNLGAVAADANAEVVAAEVLATQALFAGTASAELLAAQRTVRLGHLPLTVERTAELAAQPLALQFQGVAPTLAAQLSPTGIAFQLEVRNLAESGIVGAAALDPNNLCP